MKLQSRLIPICALAFMGAQLATATNAPILASTGGAATANSVLILGSTLAGSAGSSIPICSSCGTATGSDQYGSSWEAFMAWVAGFDVEIATDNVWSSKTSTQFATYKALILGDGNFSDKGAGTGYNTAFGNAATWGSVTTGNILILGAAPASVAGGGESAAYQAQTMIGDGIIYAGSGRHGTGAYICLSAMFSGIKTPANVDLLSNAYPTSTWQVYGDGSTTSDVPTNQVDISPGLPPHLANYASADFNNWNASIQEYFIYSSPRLAIIDTHGFVITAKSNDLNKPYIVRRNELDCLKNQAYTITSTIQRCTPCPRGCTASPGQTKTCTCPTPGGGFRAAALEPSGGPPPPSPFPPPPTEALAPPPAPVLAPSPAPPPLIVPTASPPPADTAPESLMPQSAVMSPEEPTPDSAPSPTPAPVTPTEPAPTPPVCKDNTFLDLYKGTERCKLCVSRTSPSAYDATKKCYRSVSSESGAACSTAVIVASPVKKRKGQCLDPASKHHSVKLRLSDSSGGVVLKSVVLSSLRLGGPRGLGRLNAATLRKGGSEPVVNFRDPFLAFTVMSGRHVTLTGYSKAKYTNLHVCFTALVRIC